VSIYKVKRSNYPCIPALALKSHFTFSVANETATKYEKHSTISWKGVVWEIWHWCQPTWHSSKNQLCCYRWVV